jgi:hypothetical protein
LDPGVPRFTSIVTEVALLGALIIAEITLFHTLVITKIPFLDAFLPTIVFFVFTDTP